MFRLLLTVGLLAVQSFAVFGLEIGTEDGSAVETTTTMQENAKDLYVIRKVVYEIGILTDADNSSTPDNKTHEQIDVSFFDPQDNGTFVDLSNIPFPVETNISGVSVTGIVKTDLGAIIFPKNGSMGELNDSVLTPLFPDKQVKVTRNITTAGGGINDILGLTQRLRKKSAKDSSKESQESSEENE